MIKKYTYVDLYLFPVYVNQKEIISSVKIVVKRHNSSKKITNTNNDKLHNLYTKVVLSNISERELPSNNYYSNFQLITDLFDIILTNQSPLRDKNIDKSINYMLRREEFPIEFTDNRYIANFSMYPLEDKKIILIANPSMRLSEELINKRNRLNECL